MAFGSFDTICQQSSLPLCSLIGPPSALTSIHNPLLLPQCSARSIELANTIIFQAATDVAHIAALAMTMIMIFHVRSKFTAVGRREILTFFYTYLILTVVSLVLDAGVLEATNAGVFPFFVAIQNGLTSALCTSLLINGFVGFQLYEDGTTLSVWLLRLTCLGTFVISFAVSLLTFKGWAGLGPENTTGLFVVVYLINAICLGVYLLMQIVLVVNTLQDRWPLGDIAFGVFFFVVGQVILYVLGTSICEGTSHYLDGLFFATVCNLLAVMMVYKYWDSITKEDLEFSVGTKQGNWEVKENFYDPSDDPIINRQSFYEQSALNRSSTYDTSSLDYNPRPQSQHLNSNYGGYSHGRRSPQPLLNGHGYAAMVEGRQSYGDVRKSANVTHHAAVTTSSGPAGLYDEFEPSTVNVRSRDNRHTRGLSREGELVYDRY